LRLSGGFSWVLGAQFYETLLAHAVPLDPEAIAKLKNNSLGLDCYAWLAHRLCRIRTDQGTRLSWDNLRQQFGHEYKDSKDFKKQFLGALRKVLATYKAAHVEQVRGGLRS
jgi:Plasmid encoded RepA protein